MMVYFHLFLPVQLSNAYSLCVLDFNVYFFPGLYNSDIEFAMVILPMRDNV